MPRKPGTSGSEGGRRKRTRSPGTSSAAYPTSCPRSIGAAGRAEASANAEPAAYLTAVPGVARHRQGVHLPVADLHPGGIGGGIQLGADGQPVRVVVAAMLLTMTWWLVSGRPRQLVVMWANSRCSILFHLEVPGGKWHTVISSPASAANAASSAFHARVR